MSGTGVLMIRPLMISARSALATLILGFGSSTSVHVAGGSWVSPT